jgi:hypothetical protein
LQESSEAQSGRPQFFNGFAQFFNGCPRLVLQLFHFHDAMA